MTIDTDQRDRLTMLLDPTTPPAPRPRPVRATGVQGMRTKLVETVDPTSQLTGEFTARVSDYQVDRQNERFARGAFDNAIAKVKAERRATPVLFGHDQHSVEAIIGHVGPDGWEANDQGLHATGHIDLADTIGMKIYKMLQKNALSRSVGFTVTRSTPPRAGQPGVLEEVGELFELSAVVAPANPRTETLSLKHDHPDVPSHDEVEAMLADAGIIAPVLDPDVVEEAHAHMLHLLRNGEEHDHEDTKSADTKHKSTEVKVASFDC